jgi:hypothetical protein
MRNATTYPLAFLLSLTAATASSSLPPPPPPSLPFSPAVLESAWPDYGNDDTPLLPPPELELELLRKRDGNCAKGYNSCNYANAPAFCCKSNAVCTIDAVGHAVCCPLGVMCTGTVDGSNFVTGGPVNTATGTTNFGAAATITGLGSGGTTNGIGFVGGKGSASTTTGLVAPGAAVTANVIANAYYPFKVIPTTYVDAAACSAAWTGCQTDMTRCTSYLGGGVVGGGVTISAPNYVSLRATTTMPMPAASSICASLSQQACSGLMVSACAVFGTTNAAATVGCGFYGAGMGAAVGIAGQMLLR